MGEFTVEQASRRIYELTDELVMAQFVIKPFVPEDLMLEVVGVVPDDRRMGQLHRGEALEPPLAVSEEDPSLFDSTFFTIRGKGRQLGTEFSNAMLATTFTKCINPDADGQRISIAEVVSRQSYLQ